MNNENPQNIENSENFLPPEEPKFEPEMEQDFEQELEHEIESGSKKKKTLLIILAIVAVLIILSLCCVLPIVFLALYGLTASSPVNPNPPHYNPNEVDKPVIYLYPEEELRCDVSLDLPGSFTYTYPTIESGESSTYTWSNLTVSPDGTITDADNKQYYCLFWEATLDEDVCEELNSFETGFCVKGSETEEFLEDILKQQGLNDREIQEFLIYWVPQMQDNEYNLISFPNEAYSEDVPLTVSETPDTVIRVLMTWKASESDVDLEPQTFETPERNGFTVVEWGGIEF